MQLDLLLVNMTACNSLSVACATESRLDGLAPRNDKRSFLTASNSLA